MKKKPTPETRVEWMDLDTIKPHPENPKEHDLDAIVASMRAFGFRGAVIYDEASGLTSEGHGRVEALRVLRADSPGEPPENIRIARGRWLVPVVRGQAFASEDHARAFLITSNRLTELGGWNEKLETLFDGLQDELASLTGFTDEAVALLAAKIMEEVDIELQSVENDRSEQANREGAGVTKLIQVILSAEQSDKWVIAMRELSAKTGLTSVSDLVFHAVMTAAK